MPTTATRRTRIATSPETTRRPTTCCGCASCRTPGSARSAVFRADYRQLILLRHRQHCRYDEIARITQLPIGTVKNRIFRAREMLRHELADVLDPEVRA